MCYIWKYFERNDSYFTVDLSILNELSLMKTQRNMCETNFPAFFLSPLKRNESGF